MAKSLELKVITGKAAGRVLVIPPSGATIGRHPPAELVLDEPSISRQHCSIYPRRDHWVVEDLSSQNGTLVNGVPVTKEVLRSGDEIQVGDTLLRVPRSMRTPVIIAAAAAAGLPIVILLCHWAAAQPIQPAPDQKSASAVTGGVGENSPDSDLTDLELLHPRIKRSQR